MAESSTAEWKAAGVEWRSAAWPTTPAQLAASLAAGRIVDVVGFQPLGQEERRG